MTRPSEIKPREGQQPAALYKDWKVGAEFSPLPFTITPDIVREYNTAIDADLKNYVIDGRQARADQRHFRLHDGGDVSALSAAARRHHARQHDTVP